MNDLSTADIKTLLLFNYPEYAIEAQIDQLDKMNDVPEIVRTYRIIYKEIQNDPKIEAMPSSMSELFLNKVILRIQGVGANIQEINQGRQLDNFDAFIVPLLDIIPGLNLPWTVNTETTVKCCSECKEPHKIFQKEHHRKSLPMSYLGVESESYTQYTLPIKNIINNMENWVQMDKSEVLYQCNFDLDTVKFASEESKYDANKDFNEFWNGMVTLPQIDAMKKSFNDDDYNITEKKYEYTFGSVILMHFKFTLMKHTTTIEDRAKIDVKKSLTLDVKGDRYYLKSLIIHVGSDMNSGHYFAYVRTSTNTWYEANDSTITLVTIDQVQQGINQNKITGAFYETNNSWSKKPLSLQAPPGWGNLCWFNTGIQALMALSDTFWDAIK